MSENEIKPVDRMIQQLRNEGFDEAADMIDRLTAERDAAESQRNGYMEQHCRDSAELRAVCAERDEAQRKLSVAVASGNALVADMKRLSALEAAFYEAKALSEERAPEYQVAYNYILDRAAAIDPARAEGGV